MTANRQRKTTDASTSPEAPAEKTAEKAPAKKAAAKKTAAKKTAAKKAPAKKAPAKKAAAKKAPVKESADKTSEAQETRSEDGTSENTSTRTRASAPRAESRPRASALEVAGTAAEQLSRLTGKGVEGVTGIESGDDGWRVTVEILELRRIPDSTDVLALYEVDADEKGNLMGYRRLRRYSRGSAGED